MKHLVFCAAFALCTAPAFAQTYQSLPTDDVWVYSFAGDQTADGFLRAWGNGTSAVASTSPAPENWSYSYAKWNVGGVGAGNYRLAEAKLLVTNQVSAAQPGYTLSQGIANPLEARPVGTNFEEDTWAFADSATLTPGANRFGTGDLSNYLPRGTAGVNGFQIAIDLLAEGDFSTYFNNAVNGNGELGLAFTSTLSPAGQGGATYRLYSKDSPTGLGPQLLLRYQAVPEPGTAATLAAVLVPAGIVSLRRKRQKRNAK